MTTKVEKSIEVAVPVSTAYNQWTQFEDFPQFMGGVSEVTQQGDKTLHWVAEIAGVKREWDATILEQVPDAKVAWAATSGATNAGAVTFAPLGADRTQVTLSLEYEPEGLVEKVGDAVGFIGKQAESDLEKFKSFIESRGTESGAWRGSVDDGVAVGTPGVEDAAASQGDSGKAGVSGKAVAAGVAAAAAGVAAVAAAAKSGGDKESEPASKTVPVEMLVVDETDVAQTGLEADLAGSGATGAGYAASDYTSDDDLAADVPATDDLASREAASTGTGTSFTGTGVTGADMGTDVVETEGTPPRGV